jgi:LemA protein
MVLIIVVVVAVALVGGFLIIYNRLVRRRNRVDNAWAQVDVQLRRRYDLIPNLVETVKGYAAHEQETFEAVVAARNTAQQAASVADQAEAEGMVGSMLRRLFALVEQYPELRASENFQDLQRQLGETEDRIAIARQIYNDSVLTYNNTVQTVPSNLVAAIARFRTREFFEVEDDARSVPRADF